MVTTNAKCICGAEFEIVSNNPERAQKFIDLWWSQHSGKGHGPAKPPPLQPQFIKEGGFSPPRPNK